MKTPVERAKNFLFEDRPSRASENVLWKVEQILYSALIYSSKRNTSPHLNILKIC